MTRMVVRGRWLAAFLLLFGMTGVGDLARAQGAGELGVGDLIDLVASNEDIGRVVGRIRDLSGANIVVAPGVVGRVDIALRRVSWRKVLEEAARQADCVVEDMGDYVRVSQPPRISMQFHNTDIKVVLDILARYAGANIVVSKDVKGEVSLNLRDVHWYQALVTIVKTAGFAIVREAENVIRVVRKEDLEKQLETRIFPLYYLRPPGTYRAVIRDRGPGQSGEGGGNQGTFFVGDPQPTKGDGIEEFTLLGALKRIIEGEKGGGGSIEYNIETNSFIVTATRPRLDEIAEIIRRVDVQPGQIHVQVRFVRTSINNLVERGLRFQDPTGTRHGIDIRTSFNTDFFNPGDPNDPTNPGARGGVDSDGQARRVSGQFPFELGESLSRAGSRFQVPAVLDFQATQAVLRYVNADTNSRIVQEPQVMTQDGREATIFVGENVPYAEQKATVDQNGNVTVTLEENANSPVSVGFTLFVTPNIVRDSDRVLMTIITKATGLTGTSSGVPGFERFTFKDPRSGVESFIDLPRTQNQTLVTKLLVDDEHTAVLGGLLSETRSSVESRLPILSRLPLLGNLFTFRSNSVVNENLLIFITPKIILGAKETREVFDRAQELYQRHDYFFPFEAGEAATGEPEGESPGPAAPPEEEREE